MLKRIFILFLIVLPSFLNAQIRVDKFDLTIQTELSDTLQRIYELFLNNDVEKISIVELKKKYSHHEYYSFLKNKKFYQSRKKWIKENSYVESIILLGKRYPFAHVDSIVFEYKFRGVDREFIGSETVLDSAQAKMALTEMFNGAKTGIITMCYHPRNAVVFYNSKGKITGIYEICFECSNVKIGITGTTFFAKELPYLKSLFESNTGN